MADDREELAIGVDVGGTKINVGLIGKAGEIVAELSLPTCAAQQKVMERISLGIRTILAETEGRHPLSSLKGIGVGSAGQIDFRTGQVRHATSLLPGYTGTPVKALLEDMFRTTVYVDNDVNVLALAEKRLGAGRQYEHFICLALGTGVGGAIMSGGGLLRGARGAAGELGHIAVDPDGPRCSCGNSGCLEVYASGPAIERMMREHSEPPGRGGERSGAFMDGRQAAKLWEQGDPRAVRVFERVVRALGSALASLIHIFNPQAIILGGGVADIGAPLFRRLEAETAGRTMSSMYEEVRLLPACMGAKSGMIGAALQVWEYDAEA